MVALSHLSLFTFLAPLALAATFTQLSDTAYTALLNPSRGFITQSDVYLSESSSYITTSSLAWPLSQNSVLGQAMIYLDTHLDGSVITDTELTSIGEMFAAYRQAGMKIVVRFAYTDSESGTTDVSVSAMEGHIEQLGEVMSGYDDVIFVVQQGFIGTWGEQYYSTNFGTNGIISTSQWTDRNTIAQKLLDAIPTNAFGQMRTPAYKQTLMNSTAVSVDASNKFSSDIGARLGHFDDCVFGSTTDEGTYRDTTSTGADHIYVQAESLYTPRGGETCGSSDSTSLYTCSAAISQLSLEHWTFLNVWYTTMLDAWQSGGCYDEMIANLGYRLELISATFDDAGELSLEISNTGYASIMQAYDVQLLLLPTSLVNASEASGTYTALVGNLSSIDVRSLAANTTSTIGPLDLCTSGTGDSTETYELFLSINDGHSAIATNPAYRILFGTEGMQSGSEWIAKTRINRLNTVAANVTVSEGCTVNLDSVTVSVVDGVLTGF